MSFEPTHQPPGVRGQRSDDGSERGAAGFFFDRWRLLLPRGAADPVQVAAPPQIGETDQQHAEEDQDIEERDPGISGGAGLRELDDLALPFGEPLEPVELLLQYVAP